MAVPIQTLNQQDTAYIAKHNGNYSALKSAIELLQASLGNTSQANLTAPLGFEAAFGNATTFIGEASYVGSLSNTTTVTLSAGYCWDMDLRAVIAGSAPQSVIFSGADAAGTYYIHLDSIGTPNKDLVSANAVYSVVWSGTALSALTLLAPRVWAYAEWLAAKVSTALGVTYAGLDARLEAGETIAVAASAAATPNTVLTTKVVAGGVNVTVSAIESKAVLFSLTGALTANIDTLFPLATTPRLFSVANNTTGAFTLRVKGSGQTGGVYVPQGYTTMLRHDGTNISLANSDAYVVAKVVPYAVTITLDWSQFDTAHITLTGNTTIVHTNARAGQKCLLYLAQDAVGGRTVTWGAEVQYGSDIAGISLSTLPGKTDEIGFSYNWVTSKYNAVSLAKGY